MKVYTTFILTSSASITRGVTYAKLTHTVARGWYTSCTRKTSYPATMLLSGTAHQQRQHSNQ